jgi:hypothetical protein
VFCFSGHGTWVPDVDGDETDKRDEALCCFDYNDNGLLTDDELHHIFQNRRYRTRVAIISDSCHSGTLARGIVADPEPKIPKFIPPPEFTDISVEEAVRIERVLPTSKPRSSAVLISGCADHEYSYDATFEGRPNGAMTYHLRKALDEALTPSVSDVYAKLQTYLPSAEYPQTPQLTAGAFQRLRSLL